MNTERIKEYLSEHWKQIIIGIIVIAVLVYVIPIAYYWIAAKIELQRVLNR